MEPNITATSEPTLTGQCACGAVRFQVQAIKTYGVCHCQMCRQWTAGVWMGVRVPKHTQIDGPLQVWKSSGIADRGTCGSSIWHRPKPGGDMVLGQGPFDDQSGWTMNRQIFADRQPDHYGFGDRGVILTAWGTLWALLTGRMPK